jgi:hypothetical protein
MGNKLIEKECCPEKAHSDPDTAEGHSRVPPAFRREASTVEEVAGPTEWTIGSV